jgi:hypothetical protein
MRRAWDRGVLERWGVRQMHLERGFSRVFPNPSYRASRFVEVSSATFSWPEGSLSFLAQIQNTAAIQCISDSLVEIGLYILLITFRRWPSMNGCGCVSLAGPLVCKESFAEQIKAFICLLLGPE